MNPYNLIFDPQGRVFSEAEVTGLKNQNAPELLDLLEELSKYVPQDEHLDITLTPDGKYKTISRAGITFKT